MKAWTKEEHLEASRISWLKHGAKYRAHKRQKYRENREKELARSKKYHSEHPEVGRKCQAKNMEKYRDAKRSKYSTVARKRILAIKYGLTLDQFEVILSAQKEGCLVCRKKFKNSRDIHIDHCHNTLVIRGLLCRACNLAEGLLKTPDTARRLYEYMLKNELFYQGVN